MAFASSIRQERFATRPQPIRLRTSHKIPRSGVWRRVHSERLMLACCTPNPINSFKCVSACDTEQPSTQWLGNVILWLLVTFLSIRHWILVGRQRKKSDCTVTKIANFHVMLSKKRKKNRVDKA